jgi:predicted ester cyclase
MQGTQKKQIVRDIFEQGWNEQQFDEVAPYFAATITFHFRAATHHTNLAHLQQTVAAWHLAFPDLAFAVVAIIGEGDLLAANLLMSGTQQGAWKEIAPGGNRFQVDAMFFFRFAGDRLAEVWEVYDELAMRAQLTAPRPHG